MKKPAPLERQIHLGIVHALHMLAAPNVVWWHTANERKTSKKEGALLKRLGVKAGVPDFIILAPDRVRFLEVKRPGKYLSPAQRDMEAALERIGLDVTVVRSIDGAISHLEEWGVIRKARVTA